MVSWPPFSTVADRGWGTECSRHIQLLINLSLAPRASFERATLAKWDRGGSLRTFSLIPADTKSSDEVTARCYITRTRKQGPNLGPFSSDCGSETGTRVQPLEKFQKVGHSLVLADSLSTCMPGSTAGLFRRASSSSSSTAARSDLVMTAASALLKIVGYFTGLSSASPYVLQSAR